jgi:hypothetical protein
MRITPSTSFISWISTRPAAGLAAATSRPPWTDCSCTKRPVAFCAGLTVARTQGSVAVVWAWTEAASRTKAKRRAQRSGFILGLRTCGLETFERDPGARASPVPGKRQSVKRNSANSVRPG